MNATVIDTKQGARGTGIGTEMKSMSTIWDAHPSGHWLFATHDPAANEIVAGIPASMIASYALEAAIHARIEILDDGTYFADVVGLDGVWGDGDSETSAVDDLVASIQAWVEVKLARQAPVPVLGAIDLNPRLEQAS